MQAALLERSQRWECPNCTVVDVTTEANPHTRFHSCAGLMGMTSPMVPAGTRCKIEAVEREDMVGDDIVQTDGAGRPIMAVVTTREDGQDCIVFAPLATGSLERG